MLFFQFIYFSVLFGSQIWEIISDKLRGQSIKKANNINSKGCRKDWMTLNMQTTSMLILFNKKWLRFLVIQDSKKSKSFSDYLDWKRKRRTLMIHCTESETSLRIKMINTRNIIIQMSTYALMREWSRLVEKLNLRFIIRTNQRSGVSKNIYFVMLLSPTHFIFKFIMVSPHGIWSWNLKCY